MQHWLFKSEPEPFGIEHLKKAKTTVWDGVRNYQARNFLRTATVGDLAFFYHSKVQPPGIAGLCEVIAVNVTDPTQFDPTSHYFDSKSSPDNPRWQTVKVRYTETFANYISLDTLRDTFSDDDLMILKAGSRLSVTPVDNKVAGRILKMARA
jgi:predicted RNA-binding protein with PUA-like domain